jgi:signal transduction histidine kinase/ligand-binding sensor domain-containing protein
MKSFSPFIFPLRSIFLLLIVALFAGCQTRKDSGNFPESDDNTTYAVKKISLGKPISAEWIDIPTDSIGKVEVTKLDFNALPSKPFDMGDEKPLLKPMDEKKIDWNSILDTAFNLKDLPTEKLTLKTIILDEPTIYKPVITTLTANAVRGLSDFKLPKDVMGSIRVSMKDHTGFLWFGADKGLLCYDGNTVVAYEKNKGLPKFSISSLLEDKDHKIWIGTQTGDIYIFDRKTRALQHVLTSFNVIGATFGMLQDAAGKMWIPSGNKGILIIDRDSNYIKEFSQKQGLSGNFIVKPFQDKQNRIWLPTENGVNVVNQKNKTFKRLNTENVLYGNKERQFVAGITQDSSSNLIYIGGAAGLQILDIGKGMMQKLDETHGFCDSVGIIEGFMDASGSIWSGSEIGTVYNYNPRTKSFKSMKVVPGGGNVIYSFSEDSYGQIWMGSIGNGMFVYNPTMGKPGNYTTNQGIGNNRVWSVKEDKSGKIWIGTYDGIDIYDPINRTLKHIGIANGLPDIASNKIIIDPENKVWAMGFRGGVAQIDFEKNTLTNHGLNGILSLLGKRTIQSISSGEVWLGTNNAEIYKYDYRSNTLKKYVDTLDKKEFPVNHIYVDKSGLVWIISSGNGIKIFDPETNTYRRLTKSEGLTSNFTICITEKDDEFWIGTTDNGIDVINLNDKTIRNINTQDGLANEGVWNLDTWNGKIYAGNTAGLSVISEKDIKKPGANPWNIYTINREHGLTFLDFASNSSLISSRNQLWAGVENQILTVIDEPKIDTSPVTSFVTGFSIFDKPFKGVNKMAMQDYISKEDTLWFSDSDTAFTSKKSFAGLLSLNSDIQYDSLENNYQLPVNLKLPNGQNFLKFYFTGRQMNSPNDITYSYFLEGIDKIWSNPSTSTESENYRELPSGDYTFKVVSKGLNGKWGTPAEFKFTILPPWWRSWWAYGIYLLLAAIFIRIIHLYQKNRTIQKEQEKIKERELAQKREIEKAFQELAATHENLKSTQNLLIQAEKMASLGELTAGIAHEIQNPMNFVNNFSEVSIELLDELKSELHDDNKDEALYLADELIQNMEKIVHHGKRADSIVKGMLQHSRSSSGVKELTDINALCDEYLRLSYHGLRAKDKSFNANLKSDFDPSAGKIEINPQDMGRAILNIITNAFYAVNQKKKSGAVPYDPTVTISTKRKNDHIEIKISDNGNGIPDHIKEKIFQPFFTTKPTGQGTGLGLSLTYDIIKAHGGSITVETSSETGTTFIITI